MHALQAKLAEANTRLPYGYSIQVIFGSPNDIIKVVLISPSKQQESRHPEVKHLFTQIDAFVDKAIAAQEELLKARAESPVFTHSVKVSGNYNATFHFTSKKAAKQWMVDKVPGLIREYGENIKATLGSLPGLRVGDKCGVYGEGMEEFTIVGVHSYQDDYYAFILDSGEAESVHKCFEL